jgi:hypothetical protein
MQLANYDLRMTAGRPRYPIMFRVSGYSHKSYFTLATVPGLASLTLSPKGSLSYIYPNTPPMSVAFRRVTRYTVVSSIKRHMIVTRICYSDHTSIDANKKLKNSSTVSQ